MTPRELSNRLKFAWHVLRGRPLIYRWSIIGQGDAPRVFPHPAKRGTTKFSIEDSVIRGCAFPIPIMRAMVAANPRYVDDNPGFLERRDGRWQLPEERT